ncbi:MAG: TIR domain-containing protein [Bryobacteraceae bacterium]
MEVIDHPGRVVAFYSYKGGAGRTAAVANTAAVLGRAHPHERVLAIDWDLEAPGLHGYFPGTRELADPPQAGVADYFRNLVALIQRQPSGYLKDEGAPEKLEREIPLDRYITRDAAPGVDLMTAGRHDDPSAQIDWADLYRNHAPVLLAAMNHLASKYRWCLIDCRSGRSALSSICVNVLPSVVVTVFQASQQSLRGTAEVVKRVLAERTLAGRSPLIIYPLLSLLPSAQPALVRQAISLSSAVFEAEFREVFQLGRCDLRSYFERVSIPLDSPNSFEEGIAVLDAPASPVASAFERFCEHLRRLENPWESLQRIFVSYSHRDREAKDLMVEQLAALQREGVIEHVWDDSKIRPGDPWEQEIEDAMADATVAIFLVSAPFLNSEFIRTKEVPTFLERRRRTGVRIIPVLVDHCPWEKAEWLRRLQMVTNNGKPITGTATRKKLFAKLALDI